MSTYAAHRQPDAKTKELLDIALDDPEGYCLRLEAEFRLMSRAKVNGVEARRLLDTWLREGLIVQRVAKATLVVEGLPDRERAETVRHLSVVWRFAN